MKLPAEIKTLCSRIAHERTRPVMTRTSLELRKQAQAMLASGSPAMLVDAHLHALLADAHRAQASK